LVTPARPRRCWPCASGSLSKPPAPSGPAIFRGIFTRHIFADILQPLHRAGAIGMAGAVLAEATMSFLGLGVRRPRRAGDRCLNDARPFLFDAPHLVVFPAIAGDAVRRALVQFCSATRCAINLDPRTRMQSDCESASAIPLVILPCARRHLRHPRAIAAEALNRAGGVDHILHAETIGDAKMFVLPRRKCTADRYPWKHRSKAVRAQRCQPQRSRPGRNDLLPVHDLHELDIIRWPPGSRWFISGHSPPSRVIEARRGVLYLNPGSAGRGDFRLEITIGL